MSSEIYYKLVFADFEGEGVHDDLYNPSDGHYRDS